MSATEANSMTGARLRWMIRRDMQDIIAIENESFEYPWSEKDFLDTLLKRNSIGMTADISGKIVGYMVYFLNENSLELVNLAVEEGSRRNDVGSTMISRLKGKLIHPRRTRITLNIRETNLAGQLFFQHHGFRATNVLRNHYEETEEDAYVMEYTA